MRESITNHSSLNVAIVALEISNKSSLDAAVEYVRSEYGKLGDLIYNSGNRSRNGDVDSPIVLDVNVAMIRQRCSGSGFAESVVMRWSNSA
jgi:hypothetical protein